MNLYAPIRVAVCVLLLLAAGATAQTVASAGADVPSEQIQLYLQASRNVDVEDVTAAISLEDNVCRAQVTSSGVRVTGLSRGQAAVLVWAGEKRINLLVEVVDRPALTVTPTLQKASDLGVHGVVSTTASVTNSPNTTSVFGTTSVDWTESVSSVTQLRMGGTFLNEFGAGPGERTLNVARATIGYTSPTLRVNLLDFPLALRGDEFFRRVGADPPPLFVLRGADVRWQRNATSYEFFGGTTVPSYFLSMAQTARVGGTLAERRFSDAFRVYNTVVYSDAPDLFNPTQGRQQSVSNVAGFEWRASKPLFLAANTGISTQGKSASGLISYQGAAFDGFAGLRHYDSDFPLRNLRAISDVGTLATTGLGYTPTRRVRLYGYFDHRFPGGDTAGPSPTIFSASSSYGGHASVNISREHSASFAYTGTSSTTSNNLKTGAVRRFDSMLMSNLTDTVQNTGELTLTRDDGSNTGIDHHSEWSLLDTVRWRIGPSLALNGGLTYGRSNLSLATLIRQQLSLLTPEQSVAFERDPAAFLAATDLPPELRALFDSLQPSQTSIQAGIDWAHGRWRLAPTMRMGFNGGATQQHSYDFGYAASFRVSRTMYLQSTLNHQYYVTSSSLGLNRTTQFSFGLVKEFNRNPMRWVSQKVQGSQIEGRVFVDRSLRGVYLEEAEGLAGIKVVLDDGRSTVTDRDGHYEFLRLSDRIYRVSIPLEQFATAIRLTTESPVTADLRNRRFMNIDFGVVNFSRVVVLAFNDYLLNNVRQPDAPLIPDLKLQLIDAKGRRRLITSTGGGDYEVAKIEPGKYEVQVAADSVPSGYSLPADRLIINVEPASSSVVNLAFRALRTISGKVLFRVTGLDGKVELRPLAGVQLAVGDQTVTTGADGSFLVRDLPAGEIPIRVLCCAGDLPKDLTLPSGVIHLTREPQQLDNVNITINNPWLLGYILPTLAQNR